MTDPTPYAAPSQPSSALAAPAKTNVLAILSLIGGFVIPLIGIILGFIALKQIKTSGEGGHGLAVGGIIVGFIVGALQILIVVLSFVLPLALDVQYGDGY